MNKLKVLFIALCLAGTATFAHADDLLFENPFNHRYFGVRVNYDLTAVDGAENPENFHNGSGMSFGAVYNLPIFMNLYFEPGLMAYYNTIGQSKIETRFDTVTGLPQAEKIEGSIRNFGFRIPLNFGFHFDFTDHIQVAPFTGPQLNANLVSVRKFNGEHEHGIFGSGGFKHWDLQWVFGVGVSFDRVMASISGGVGMTNIMSRPGESYRRNSFTVTIGYNF